MNSEDVITRLELACTLESMWFNTTEDNVEYIEDKLGVTVPRVYWEFADKIEDAQILTKDLVFENQQARQNEFSSVPDYLLVFFCEAKGLSCCFDTRYLREDGECPVVVWDHSLSAEEQSDYLDLASPTFEAWLDDYVQKIPTEESSADILGSKLMLVVICVVVLMGLSVIAKALWGLFQ